MKTFITVFLFFLVIGVKSQDQRSIMSLSDILLHIQSHSSHLSMYDAQVSSLQASVKGTRSWNPPEFATGFWMTPYNPKYWIRKSGMAGMGQYMISGQQTFPDKKKQAAEGLYLESVSAVTKAEKNAKQNELFSEARKNFYQWDIAKQKISVLNQDLETLNFMIQSSEIRYRNSMGKIGAYYKVKASIGTLKNMKILAENDINQKRIAINTLMHMPPNTYFDIDSNAVMNLNLEIKFDSVTLIKNRSDIKALDNQIIVSNLQQKAERTKLRPEYGIRYDHMFGFGSLPMQFTLMGMVKIPLAKWSARSYYATIESLHYKSIAQQEERQALINESLGMGYSLMSEIDTKQRQIHLYDTDIIPALKRNYQTSLLAYQNNTEDLFVLYDAWEKLNLIRLEYLDIKEQLYTDVIELKKIMEIVDL